MDSNTHSAQCPPEGADGLAVLAHAVEELAGQDLDGLSDAVRAERVLVLRRLLDRLDGQWRKELAGVDARGAAGADQDQPAPRPPPGSGPPPPERRRRQQLGHHRPGPVRWPLTVPPRP